MEISVRDDLKKLTRDLSRLQKKQIPFAASLAINETAENAQAALKVQAQKKLDRPTRQTIGSFRVGRRSNKNNLVRNVFILPWAAEYLKYQIDGGVRTTRGKGTGVPFNQKLNKFGNIPGRKKGLVKKKKQFVATIKGISGVWERFGRKGKFIRLVTAFETRVVYRKKFNFYKIVSGVVSGRFNKNMNIAFKKALATAR